MLTLKIARLPKQLNCTGSLGSEFHATHVDILLVSYESYDCKLEAYRNYYEVACGEGKFLQNIFLIRFTMEYINLLLCPVDLMVPSFQWSRMILLLM